MASHHTNQNHQDHESVRYSADYFDQNTNHASYDPMFLDQNSYQNYPSDYSSSSSYYQPHIVVESDHYNHWNPSAPLSPTISNSESLNSFWSNSSSHGLRQDDRHSSGLSHGTLAAFKTTTVKKKEEKKFKCDFNECTSSFARKADRDRHRYCVHDKDKSEKKDCPESNCSRKGDQGFTRADHLTEHLRNFHHKQLPRKKRGRPSSSFNGTASVCI